MQMDASCVTKSVCFINSTWTNGTNEKPNPLHPFYMKSEMSKAIVLLWVENTGILFTGNQVQRDNNWFEETVACAKGYACVYSRRMDELTRANEYASQMRKTDPDKYNVRVLIMDDTSDILDRARLLALNS